MRFGLIVILIFGFGVFLGWVGAEFFGKNETSVQQVVPIENDQTDNAGSRSGGGIESRLRQLAENNPEIAEEINTAINEADGNQEKLRETFQSLLRENPELAQEMRSRSRRNNSENSGNRNRRDNTNP
tara:strand:+ start:13970 stop:14353 length:384 start_codon:yes stop_codon:yes gene_type:complete